MKQFRTGFVVGKFCPLHKGHELVIETALEQCDNVIVLSYTSVTYEKCSADNRRKWLKAMHVDQERLRIVVLDPEVDNFPPDAWPDIDHRKFCANYLLDELETTVQAVFSSEEYGQGLAGYFTLFFTSKFLYPLNVKHVMVDHARSQYRVSGTELRNGTKPLNLLTSSVVQASFIKKILFLGGESSGKSTIVSELGNHYGIYTAPEFGRYFFEQRKQQLVYEDMEYIAKCQIEVENTRLSSLVYRGSDTLFCDTSALTTAFYSKEWFGRVSTNLARMVEESFDRYDKIYICMPDYPMVQDGTRQDEKFRLKGFEYVINTLEENGVKYSLLGGNAEERLTRVKKDLE